MVTRSWMGLGVAAALGVGCADAAGGATLSSEVGGLTYEVQPLTREDIARFGEHITIDLSDPSLVWVLDRSGNEADLMRVRVICPDGREMSLGGFLIGQPALSVELVPVLAIGGALPEIVAEVLDDTMSECGEMKCETCPDGATFCYPVTDGCGGDTIAQLAIVRQDQQTPSSGDRAGGPPGGYLPPGVPPIPSGDPSPIDDPNGSDPTGTTPTDPYGGDPYSPYGGDPYAGQGGSNGGSSGSGGSLGSGGSSGSGGSGDSGDSGGPDYY